MKTLKMICLTTLLVTSAATSAYAIGDVERGALIGAGAMLLVPALFGNHQTTTYVEPRREVIYYEQPRATVVYREPYYERERVVIIDNYPPRHRPRYYDDYYDRRPSYHPDRYYYYGR